MKLKNRFIASYHIFSLVGRDINYAIVKGWIIKKRLKIIKIENFYFDFPLKMQYFNLGL